MSKTIFGCLALLSLSLSTFFWDTNWNMQIFIRYCWHFRGTWLQKFSSS